MQHPLSDAADLREAYPRTHAAALADNTDPAHPAREFRDFC